MSIPQEVHYGIASVFAVLILINLVGNSLVIRIVHTNRLMRTPMNYLLLNLAVADITVAVFLTPRYVLRDAFTHPGGVVGTYICKFLTGEAFTWAGALTSVYSLVAISIERYYAIMKPQSSKSRFTIKKSKHIAAACWVFAILWNLPLFIFSYFDEKNNFCNFAWPFKDFTKYHSTLVSFVYGAVPMPTLLYLYSRISYKLWFNNHQIGGITHNQGRIKARKRVTKMVLTVSMVFCITWIPNLVIYPLSSFTSQSLYDSVHVISIICVAINSSINPIIYSLHSNMFRKNLRQVLCCFDRDNVSVDKATSLRNISTKPVSRPAIISTNMVAISVSENKKHITNHTTSNEIYDNLGLND